MTDDTTPIEDAEVVKDLPSGDLRDVLTDVGLNCHVWGEVDFGMGPVMVRCTRTEAHIEHVCGVTITPD